MPKTLRWLNSALDELDSIHTFIANKDGLDRADSVVAEIFKQVRALVHFPERGHVVARLKPPHREIVIYSRYRLVYRITADVITVAAVIDASQRFQKAWRSRVRE